MQKANYNCSQADLYMACRAAWRLCRKNLTDFGAFKTKYSAEFIEQNLQTIEEADYLQDVNARYAGAEGLRMDLVKAKDEILVAYRHLQAYIDDAYPADKHNKMYNACGKPFYERANQCNWASVSGLLRGAIPFIQDNKAVLMANNNMPESFLDKFNGLKVRFDALLENYHDSGSDAGEKTSAKLEANNAIFDKMVALLDDGKRLYAANPAMAKNFTVTAIMSQISGTKQSGIEGKVVTGDNQNPVVGAKITVVNSSNFSESNEQGRFSIYPLSAGTYSFLVEAEGYELCTMTDIEVKTGSMKRVNFTMKAITVAVPSLEVVH